MATTAGPPPKGVKDLFYETRVLMGRDYTLRRFATEVLGGSIDPVMLGYIEKGKRLPSEALVRRLAAVRKEDPHPLLALLWRDRMLYAFGKEIRKVLRAPRAVSGIDDADLAVLISQAIAALPDDGGWVSVASWTKGLRATSGRRGKSSAATDQGLVQQVEQTLRERGLVEVRAGKVRRRGRHFVPQDTEERLSLALEFCALFGKSLIDKLVLADTETATYLRNHYLHIAPERLPEFQRRLEAALRGLAEEFATDRSAASRFLNVLVAATTL